MASLIKLNGQQIKKPAEFTIEKFNLTKSGRVASGKMTMDIIAKKRKFLFAYEILSSVDLAIILGIVDGNAPFFLLEYEEDNVVKTATVYSGAVKATKAREGPVWYWKGVNFDLIEQ